ncbi:cytidine deaminase [Polyangium jinanense]|uniref:Cytidine deaminase n=1 Tax=Polyangium jinanense TaxID=2829994 RepID=A0A9X3X9I6_9BACT|nr:cytidine deaminase [Polyangium jinanense]MDC3983981.1 cytidine deaminase [Polyangium jinanense]
MQTNIDWTVLERAALDVQARAHAPYSTYQVGAALLTASGRIFTGCNVENASYGLSICAERSAIVQMVAAGERDPIALVVVTPGTLKLGPGVESPPIGAPCGMCRQTLAEFADDLRIQMSVTGQEGLSRRTSLAALLPEAFRAKSG